MSKLDVNGRAQRAIDMRVPSMLVPSRIKPSIDWANVERSATYPDAITVPAVIVIPAPTACSILLFVIPLKVGAAE